MSWLTDIRDKLCCLNRRTTALEDDVAAIVDGSMPLALNDARLKEIVSAEGYELTSITRDMDGTPTTAVVKWPDGTSGVFTTVSKNATWLAVDAFTVSYEGVPVRTVTQAAVTRDSNGAVVVKPALTTSW